MYKLTLHHDMLLIGSRTMLNLQFLNYIFKCLYNTRSDKSYPRPNSRASPNLVSYSCTVLVI
jgi:hypothetical protein